MSRRTWKWQIWGNILQQSEKRPVVDENPTSFNPWEDEGAGVSYPLPPPLEENRRLLKNV